MNVKTEFYSHLRAESSLLAMDDVLRVDDVTVRDEAVRVLGDEDVLLNDTSCSAVDKVGRLEKDIEANIIMCLYDGF